MSGLIKLFHGNGSIILNKFNSYCNDKIVSYIHSFIPLNGVGITEYRMSVRHIIGFFKNLIA